MEREREGQKLGGTVRKEKKDYDETIGVGMSGRKRFSRRKYTVCALFT